MRTLLVALMAGMSLALPLMSLSGPLSGSDLETSPALPDMPVERVELAR